MLPSPIPITPLGLATAATVTFRSRARLHITTVLKATFALTPEGRMTLLPPDPILPDEIPDPSGRGLRAAGDLAPFLAQTDLLLTGRAEVLPSFAAPELRIWIALVRDGAVHIDRWLDLDASERVGPTRAHVEIRGAGPISRDWPRRRQLLGAIDPRHLHGPRLELPDGLDWSYFQAAPAEQRSDLLHGNEWIILGGVFAQRPRLRTQLPEARAIARLYRRNQAPPRHGAPIPLVADTLQIDTDRRCVSILFRGHTPIEEAEISALHVVAGLESPGHALGWMDPFAASGSGQHAAAIDPHLASTGEQENPLRGTLSLSHNVAQKLRAIPVTPFTTPSPLVRLEPEEGNPLSGTQDLPDEMARKLRALPVTPFTAPAQLGASDPAAGNPLSGTQDLPDEMARKLRALPVTPFTAPAQPGVDTTSSGTLERSPDQIAQLRALPTTSFSLGAVEEPQTVPANLSTDLGESPSESLGAAFLAAIAATGKPG
jgi:Uncharacterized protein conserved in bacteria (DUF2169)